ncbi:iron transporter [Labrys miyagiensis]|uniref:Iron transporter n=1 Tax=Labrys miyagiensis TaxID=346912 RepID=A0ABQ6CJL8_9HYPH|nr:Nramp family divalent metal transporter [Labrys miyagiensis]GLS20552.1 iron transporter [Labrys miyagiensis]
MTDQADVGLSQVPQPEKKKKGWLSILGPGLITGASDDDPSGIATYSQIGAQFGYGMSWTLLFSYPLMTAVQIISARIGRTTGRGIAGNLRKYYPNWLVYISVAFLLVANIINIGADIGAMGDGIKLLVGGPEFFYALGIGALCIVLQVFTSYKRYVNILKWLTLALLAYVATLFMVKIDWSALARGLFIPSLSLDLKYVTGIVAIFGTTISPYLFFWQASQEVEDLNAEDERERLKDAPEQSKGALNRISLDTFAGMGVSNLIALSILVTAAATLNAQGKTDISSSAEAAAALKPVAGAGAEILFVLGIVGTGLLAVPVLAGSAAYAVGEMFRLPTGLDRKPLNAKAFYGVIAVATAIGAALNLTPINPISALYWSAVINGIVAAPIMFVLMLLSARQDIMGDGVISAGLKFWGWLATAVMTAAAVVVVTGAFLQR